MKHFIHTTLPIEARVGWITCGLRDFDMRTTFDSALEIKDICPSAFQTLIPVLFPPMLAGLVITSDLHSIDP